MVEDLIKKTLQFTKGMVIIGKDNISSLGKELKKKYELDDKTSKEMTKEILKNTKDSAKEIHGLFKKHMRNILDDYEIIKKKKKTAKKTETTKTVKTKKTNSKKTTKN